MAFRRSWLWELKATVLCALFYLEKKKKKAHTFRLLRPTATDNQQLSQTSSGSDQKQEHAQVVLRFKP